MRDHGGDLDRAMAEYGAGRWLDLSTGINPQPYPVPQMEGRIWSTLPTRTDIEKLCKIAAQAYGTAAEVVPLAGAQAAIQLVPRLGAAGQAAIVGPTYNEHAGALRAQGWAVDMVAAPEDAKGVDLLVVVNPNNPDGRSWSPETLLGLRGQVGRLVVDESFADMTPERSLAPHLERDGEMVVLRSFGKFYGLAGLRLGFALTGRATAETLRALAGPWAVNGPAIATGCAALGDKGWHAATCARLAADADRLDALAASAGWSIVGGTSLFRCYETGDAAAAQTRLAKGKIWSRIFPYSAGWLRLGLPGCEEDWAQLGAALGA